MDNRENQGGALSRRPQGSLSRGQGGGLWTDPWREMEEMRRRMDALFGRVFGFGMPDLWERGGQGVGQQLSRVAEPDVDIYENDGEYIIHAALPGVDPQDIHLEATEDSVTLTAETRSGFEEPGQGQEGGTQTTQQQSGQATGTQTGQAQPQRPATQHRQSRYSSVSRFQFAYTLPAEIDPNAVRANFRNGRLELHLPKRQPASNRTVSIPVQSGGATQPAGSISGQTGTPSTAHEGAPSRKMGTAYTPSASEDHTAQAAAAGERMEGHTSREGQSSVTTGSTNPTQPQPTAGAGTTEGESSGVKTGTGQP